MIEFTVIDWSAWAPGLQTRQEWLDWAKQPFLPHGEQTPALSEVPAMQRRRIERLGRMAIQTAYWCQEAQAESVPLVFASRHGDVERSMELLRALANDEPLSPTGFGLSVHNAIAALYSIIRGMRGNYLALAAGKTTAEAACVEAAGLLADGAPEVLVVGYEAPLPDVYKGFADEPDPFYAWSWRVGQATEGKGTPLRLSWGAASRAVSTPVPASTAAKLPHGLDVQRFLLTQDRTLEFSADGVSWTWQRHA
ncbi:beta-ketoacyl synthase chain length factor [Pseudoxanthomonas sp. UTMC 1351]|uniref:beta-ketoacyl synthase chain length factor n=1 Tax=Pseudoxanthomonas sp. UTMC 1351 TaxID=2695853 RepID=UPI0034CE300C